MLVAARCELLIADRMLVTARWTPGGRWVDGDTAPPSRVTDAGVDDAGDEQMQADVARADAGAELLLAPVGVVSRGRRRRADASGRRRGCTV